MTRPLFLRDSALLPMVPIGLFVLMLFSMAMIGYSVYQQDNPPKPPTPGVTIQHYDSLDGKVRCYVATKGVSCLPMWLLDKPANWVIAYPTAKGKK